MSIIYLDEEEYKGPKTEPCGTPQVIFSLLDTVFLNFTT